MKTVEQIIAETLKVTPSAITDELSYSSTPEWDSLNHVNLMLALESNYGVVIDEDVMIDLTSVRAIKSFINGQD